MCRHKSEGGRRCPCRSDPVRRLLESARQRVSRYARWADAAGDDQGRDHNARLFESALADMQRRTGTEPAPTPTPAPTRAGEFTPASTAEWSDDQLAAALGECWDDQQAVDAIAELFDQRDRHRQLADGLTSFPDHGSNAWEQLAAERQNTSMIDKPGNRPSRRLTAEQQARTDYETMREVWYLQAEYECAGHLLSKHGQAAGIDARTLWTGPVTTAQKYASPELQSWWARNGRLTWQAFRGQALGRRSDRAQVESVRAGKAFDDAIPA